MKRERQDKKASNDPSEDPTSRRGNANKHGTEVDEGVLPSPHVARSDPLAALAETAKNYARASNALTTPTGGISPPGCAAGVFRNCRPTRRRSGSISPPASTALDTARSRQASPRWSAAFPGFAGITASLATRSVGLSRMVRLGQIP